MLRRIGRVRRHDGRRRRANFIGLPARAVRIEIDANDGLTTLTIEAGLRGDVIDDSASETRGHRRAIRP
jgi:hypothetical protein